MTPEQLKALKELADGIIEIVKAAPLGKPSGHLYAMLMPYGCSLEQFETIMRVLVQARKVRKQGDLYFTVSEATRKVAEFDHYNR